MPRPAGYDRSHEKPCTTRADCVIGVGFDRSQGKITRFLGDLQYTETITSPSYTQIARIDHNPAHSAGHDLYREGIHVDARSKHGPNTKFHPAHSHVPRDLGTVIAACADYLDRNAPLFVAFYDGSHRPSNAPHWTP